MAPHAAQWVECACADLSSVARGKIVRADDFVHMTGCRLPSVVLGLTLTSGEPEAVFGPLLPDSYDDVHLSPDLGTLRARPGRTSELTVICEPAGMLGCATGVFDASELSPRAALRQVLRPYTAAGLSPLVAPELELFLLQHDGEGALQAARSHPESPLQERQCEAYSLERLTHFEPFFDALYAHSETLGIPLNGHAHESALGQYEVNFLPGPALAQADAVWRFKRLARELAARWGMVASFAAKPFLDQPGTGMHWHISLQGAHGPLFASGDGGADDPLLHFIAGLQSEAAASLALFAPYEMSFERIRRANASPSHASWGHDGRTLAFRIPASSPANRRVELRLPGGDANPYLTLTAALALGWHGLQERLTPGEGEPLPSTQVAALEALAQSHVLRQALGPRLLNLYLAVKRHEQAERTALADPRHDWDLRYLIELS
ncbi:MAG: glutamine synthetase family protein [Hydrogenophaga sp.]